jgi:hypothetical protein
VLHLGETTDRSQFAIAVKGGDRLTDFGADIEVDGSLKAINAKAVNFTGGLNILGTVRSMTARDMTDVDFGVGSSGPAMTLKLGHVANMRLTTATPIASLSVVSWGWLEDTQNPGIPFDQLSRISAPWMLKGASKGDFSAIVTLNGEGAPRTTLGSFKVGGMFAGEVIVLGHVGSFSAASIDGGLLLASGLVGSFTIGTAAEATLWAGSVGKVTVGSILNLEVGAGASFTAGQFGAISDGDGSAVAWSAGSIADIKVKGQTVRARFAAGVNPVNGTLLDDDDLAAGNGAIGRITLAGPASDVLFAAVTLPGQVRIGAERVFTLEDDRFLVLEPLS